jgi:pyruvate dehydrogenase (quinone)
VAKKIAELFVEVLAAAGVERIHGVAGDSLNGITDSVRRRDGIAWVGVRHEETAAFAAGAESTIKKNREPLGCYWPGLSMST